MSSPLLSAPHLVTGLRFEDIEVGSRFRTASRTITETDMVSFRQLVGITEPLFMDASGAQDAGYTGRLVPGMLTFCYAEGLVIQTNAFHGTGLAFMHTELDIVSPVYVGDTIFVVVEATAARPSKKGGRGVVTTTNTVFNQRDEIVVTYSPARLLKGRSAEGNAE